MGDYARTTPPPLPASPHHLPRVQATWTIGTVLAASASFLTIFVVIIGGFWNYAGISYVTSNVPSMKASQENLKERVAVLEVQQRNGDSKYSEILRQIMHMSDKVDRLGESKADRGETERTR